LSVAAVFSLYLPLVSRLLVDVRGISFAWQRSATPLDAQTGKSVFRAPFVEKRAFDQQLYKVVWSSRRKWTVDTLAQGETFLCMQDQIPCTDYQETKGLIYFARMLDKIRLNAAGKLAPGYFCGVEDPTFFDSRCTRFLGVNYDELARRTLEGGSDEEILEW
jgi:hypothetical protein